MPPAPAYTVDEIFEAIKDLPLHYVDKNDECKLHSLSEPVWTHAQEKLPKMSKKYIYLYISTKRNGIYEKIVKHRNLPNPFDSSKIALDDSRTSNWSMEEAQQNLPEFPPLRKTIYVSKKDYVQIKSSLFSYDENDKLTLAAGWVNTLYSLLWENMKLPCPFSFGFAQINDNLGETLLTVRGECRECCNVVHIYLPTLELSDEGMAMHVSTLDTTGIVHKKKRFLSGLERLAVVKELQADGVYVWRRENANRKMQFGDPEPAHLYTESVLRKAKQLENDRQLGLTNVSDPIRSVEKLLYEAEFAGFLKEVCLNKFYTFYWSAEQTYLYKETFKCKDCETGSLSIDATGCLIARIKRPDGSSHSIFLYQAVVPFHGKILPVFQMISEKHDANFISYALKEWRRSGIPIPRKVVTDCSMALLNAVCIAFCDCSLSVYIDNCIKWLQAPDENPRPPCIARIDIAHQIKFVCQWKCFVGKHFRVKDFFVRCVGLLTKCDNINSFRIVFCDILIVAISETEVINSDQANGCYAAQLRLMEAIKTDAFCYDSEENCDGSDNEESNKDYPDNCTTGSEFINNLVGECKSLLVDGERPNPYYCPDFSENFIRLAKLFPLSTAVMTQDKTSVATSSFSEEYFREVKQLVLKGKSAIRVDKFLVIHMRSIAGTTKILHALHLNKDDVLQPCLKKRKFKERELTKDDAKVTKHKEVVPSDGKEFIDDVEVTLCEDDVIWGETRSCEDEIMRTEVTKGENKVTERKVTKDNKVLKKGIINGKDEVGGVKVFCCPSILAQSFETIDTPRSEKICDDPVDTCNLNDSENSNAYLNEKETWKGKSRDKKKRGKFLRPCPDIRHRHERPKSISSIIPLLKNGLLLGPVKLKNKNIMVRNTCPFDSISQSMLVAYRDWACYQDYISSTKNRFFDFIKLLDKSGCTVKVYKERAELMSLIKEIDHGVLDCMMNVSNLMKHLLKDEPSYTVDYHCKSCEKDDQVQSVVVEVDVKPFYIHGIQCLQQVVQDQLHQKRQCAVCRSKDVTETIKIGNHIIIDIESLQWARLAKNLGHPEWPGTLTVGQIPKQIHIENVTYTVQSVIEYVGDMKPSKPYEMQTEASMGHYIAHVRRITGRWEVHNDIFIGGKSVIATARILFEKKRLSILTYVRTD